MKKVSVVIVGYGDRGSIYGHFQNISPDIFEVRAVVDVDPFRLSLAKANLGLDDSCLFNNFENFLKLGKIADAAIVATMDELHYYQATELLKLKYHLLLEKPIVNNLKDLNEIERLAKENNLIVFIGHVLRYTPFYNNIKKLILQGEIGDIIHIETSELIGVCHSSSSYIRGKWNNESSCGSGILLAKCCHDLDLLCWFNNTTKPKSIVSFGDRTNVIPSRAPKGSKDRCYDDCPYLDTCQYSAKSLYVLNDIFPQYSFPNIKKKHSEITEEEKIQALKTNDPFGKCAFKVESDIVDHQCLMIKFENGSTAFHSLVMSVPRPGRKIHIIGTDGEIEGFFESGKFVLRKFDFQTSFYKETQYDINDEIEKGVGHCGGDMRLVRDFISKICNNPVSIASTDIRDSLNSHKCCYDAEESRRNNKIVDFS